MKKKEKKIKSKSEEKIVNILDNLGSKSVLISSALILAAVLLFWLPFQLDNVQPVGSDAVSNIGQSNLWVEYRNETGEQPLWNPNIFGGEPIYPKLRPKVLLFDSILSVLGFGLYWVIIYSLVGGFGMYFLLKYKQIPWYLAIIAALVFLMLPDWQALVGEGHNTKFRAIMIFPWFVLSFNYFFDKKSWFSAGLFALVFSWFFRTQHFQIIFYGILITFFIFIYPFIKQIVNKEYKSVLNLLMKFSLACVLTVLTVAQPFFSTKEYADYSTRGGNPVKLNTEKNTAQKSKGVSFDYATQWSYSPNELLDFFMPRFSGGYTHEVYKGDQFPNLKGQRVPGYWGEKPYNGNYTTMGMVLFLFAIIGIVHYRKNMFILGLTAFIVFSIFLSFGRHFPILYEIFFYNLPYFSKFRAPAMILNISFFAIIIAAAYGLKALFTEIKEKDHKWVLGVFGGGILLTVIVLLTKGSYSYIGAGETGKYDQNTLNMLKNIRLEMLTKDAVRLLIILLFLAGSVLLYLKNKIKPVVAVGLICLIAVAEILFISMPVNKEISRENYEKIENSVFRETQISKVLKEDNSGMRAIVLGQNFTSNHYAYYYPLISGYSAIKMQIIQDVIENNLFKAQTQTKINWNLINMLNGKYVIVSGMLPEPFLTEVARDAARKEILYKNNNVLPKAWFVKKVDQFETPAEIVANMNKADFNPAVTAMVLKGNTNLTDSLTAEGNIEVISSSPGKIDLKLSTASKQFLVLSEMYYPAGWKAFVNGKESKIVSVNHILRGIEVPAGESELVVKFDPTTYYSGLSFVWIGNILALIMVGGGFYLERRKKSAENK